MRCGAARAASCTSGVAQDDELSTFYGEQDCHVFAFDPTVTHPRHWKPNVTFHNWGLVSAQSAADELVHVGAPQYGNVTGELLTLPEIIARLGHQHVRTLTAMKIVGCDTFSRGAAEARDHKGSLLSPCPGALALDGGLPLALLSPSLAEGRCFEPRATGLRRLRVPNFARPALLADWPGGAAARAAAFGRVPYEFHLQASMRMVTTADVERIRYAGSLLREYDSIQPVFANPGSPWWVKGDGARWLHPDLAAAHTRHDRCCYNHGFVLRDWERHLAHHQHDQ